MRVRLSRTKIVVGFLIALFLSGGSIISVGYEWLTARSDKAASVSAKALSADEKIHCQSIPDRALIEGAAARYVQAGIAHENGDQRTESNPWRYTSVSNFLKINPDCCEVLANIPGDYSPETQNLGAPYFDPPRLYAVRMAFKEWRSNNDTFIRHEVILVDCLGKAGGGPSFDLRRGIF
jgi:hypothetical protein